MAFNKKKRSFVGSFPPPGASIRNAYLNGRARVQCTKAFENCATVLLHYPPDLTNLHRTQWQKRRKKNNTETWDTFFPSTKAQETTFLFALGLSPCPARPLPHKTQSLPSCAGHLFTSHLLLLLLICHRAGWTSGGVLIYSSPTKQIASPNPSSGSAVLERHLGGKRVVQWMDGWKKKRSQIERDLDETGWWKVNTVLVLCKRMWKPVAKSSNSPRQETTLIAHTRPPRARQRSNQIRTRHDAVGKRRCEDGTFAAIQIHIHTERLRSEQVRK